jgi:hypothetical protein
MSGPRIAIAALIAYALVGVATFGPAAAGREPDYNRLQRQCTETGSDTTCFLASDAIPPVVSGFGAALAWPFYWSWELAEPRS